MASPISFSNARAQTYRIYQETQNFLSQHLSEEQRATLEAFRNDPWSFVHGREEILLTTAFAMLGTACLCYITGMTGFSTLATCCVAVPLLNTHRLFKPVKTVGDVTGRIFFSTIGLVVLSSASGPIAFGLSCYLGYRILGDLQLINRYHNNWVRSSSEKAESSSP